MEDTKKLRANLKAMRIRNEVLAGQRDELQDRNRTALRIIDNLYEKIPDEIYAPGNRRTSIVDGISFIVLAYNIPDQIKRTLTSLTAHYQGVKNHEIEVILVDNGSTPAMQLCDFDSFQVVSKVLRVEGHPSPVFGLNKGVKEARFKNIALMIDGAHMLTPGVCKNAISILEFMPRPVINVPQYILGDVSQNLQQVENAFAVEELALSQLNWPDQGYSLFEYGMFAGESPTRHYLDAVETNCLITTKEVLDACGGYNEHFDEPGGGLANIEIFSRLCHDPENQYVTLLGEGSFHQNHGGTTTSIPVEERLREVERYWEKYRAVTGDTKNYSYRSPFVYGRVSLANKDIPTISLDYGNAKRKVLKDLTELYVQRARFGQSGKIPSLTLRDSDSDEHTLRPILQPLDNLTNLATSSGCNPADYNYRSILRRLHNSIKPRRYLEIGIDNGDSLALSNCPSIGIDPSFEITTSVGWANLFRITSDEFFSNQQRCENLLSKDLDLAFIDGMHLAEFVLRDFMNVEKWVPSNCMIVLDDVLPEQIEMAGRDRPFNAWCGDVYKVIRVLRDFRPDLKIHVFEAYTGKYRKGFAIIWGLDRTNQILDKNYEQIQQRILGNTYEVESIEELEREIVPTCLTQFDEVIEAYRTETNRGID